VEVTLGFLMLFIIGSTFVCAVLFPNMLSAPYLIYLVAEIVLHVVFPNVPQRLYGW
jgi:hypothetical protein